MKKTKDSNFILFSIILTIVLSLFATSLVVFFERITSSRYGYLYNSFVIGNIAEEDVNVISSIDIIDQEATLKAKEKARDRVLPIFSYNSIKTIESLSSFKEFRIALEDGNRNFATKYVTNEVYDRVVKLGSYEIIGISYDLIKNILKNGYFNSHDLVSALDNKYVEITVINNYLDEVPFDGELNFDVSSLITNLNINNYITDQLAQIPLDSDELYIVKYLIARFCVPNVEYDEYATQLRRNDAFKDEPSIFLSLTKGDPIILKDHVIQQENLDMLRVLSKSAPISIESVVTDFLFYCFSVAASIVLILYFNKNKKHFLSELTILSVFLALSCVFAGAEAYMTNYLNLGFEFSLIPVIFVPALAVMITGRRTIGFEYCILTSAVFSKLPGVNVVVFFFFLMLSFSACIAVRMLNRRLDMIFTWLISIFLGLVVTFGYSIVSRTSISLLLHLLIGSAFNVTVAFFLLSIIVPILERILNLPTTYRLHELAYSNSPMLTRLQNIAPGTFTHSCAVADLAEQGAKEIHANSLLARVGALYHDIGKMEHPEYFVENQSGNNKHDELNPSLSASIIKNHVKVGGQKGRDIGLPSEVVDIIECHHGNDVISYFFNEAQKENKTDQDVSESDFVYPAEIPSSKECGIVMLADSVEAASRTIPANPQKYNKLIQSIFLKKLENSQLDNCGLTTGDLKVLRNSFIKTLLAKNHSRIEYPDQEED